MRGKKVSLLLAIIITLSLAVSPAIAETGVKDGGNPILAGAESWEVEGVGTSWVLYDDVGGTYMMWYSGKDGDGFTAIGYATAGSPEGPWVKDGGNPVLLKGDIGQWDAYGVGGASVIYDADASLYKMWYTGMDASQIARIGYATAAAPEGPWTKNNQGGGGPLYTSDYVVDIGGAGTWDENGVGGPSVIREDATTYHMWYTGRDDDGTTLGVVAIGYTSSTDGVADWDTNKQGAVFEKSATPGDWDERGVGAACVIPEVSGAVTTYSMYYTGYDNLVIPGAGIFGQIGLAKSVDGQVWTREADLNPMLEAGAAASWEELGVGAPCAVKVEGVTNIWYTGSDNNLLTGIGHATAFPVASITLPAVWNMFSLPLNPVGDNYDFSLVLGDDVTASLFVFWYDPSTGGYKGWPGQYFPAEIGRGYWLRLYEETVIDVEGLPAETDTYALAPTPGKEFYTLAVSTPWNMIGAPFEISVAWEDCLYYHDATFYTIAEAHAANLLSQYIFDYNTTSGGYNQSDATNGILVPWKGYWLRVYSEGDLLIPPIEYVAP
ncbi:hypothetical protein ACFLWV_00440 [Chloroflexota bacterium]